MLKRDEMLKAAERLAQDIRQNIRQNLIKRLSSRQAARTSGRADYQHMLRTSLQNAVSTSKNELKKVISFYQRRLRQQGTLQQDTNAPEQAVAELLRQSVPRGGDAWKALGKTITVQRLTELRKEFGDTGAVFVLAWAARLLPAGDEEG
jgi:hypothetical protein